jgi:hypothetical protein
MQAEGLPADEGFRGFLRRAPRRCREAGSLEHSSLAATQTVLLHHPLLEGSDALIDEAAEALCKVSRWAKTTLTGKSHAR